jgi:endonuclease-3 related protein
MSTFDTGFLLRIHTLMMSRFGDPGWWPGDSRFEISIGAILTQNTSWVNVEAAIINLNEHNLMDPIRILYGDFDEISEAIRPAGYYNQKTRYLKNFSEAFIDIWGGDFDKMSRDPVHKTRNNLLMVKGIGKETADSILCYALDKPVFVVDAYTFRIFSRLCPDGIEGILSGPGPDYDRLRSFVMEKCRGDQVFYNRFHALLVLLGKEYCRKSPICEGCPLLNSCQYRLGM